MKKIVEEKNVENKVALSFREKLNTRILFRLFNTKRNNTLSFNIYEKAKFSTNIKDVFNNSYRKIDVDYDTTINNRFKKANLLIDLNSYLDKNKKDLYLDLINSNKEFIKTNKVSNEIIENIKYFENKVNSL
jgi:hypothetical protein